MYHSQWSHYLVMTEQIKGSSNYRKYMMYIHCTRIQRILTATNPLWPKIKTVGGLMAFQALIEYLVAAKVIALAISSLGVRRLEPQKLLLPYDFHSCLSDLTAASTVNALRWVSRKVLNLEILISERRNSYLPDTHFATIHISTASNGLVHCADVKGITWPHLSYERRLKMVLGIL